MGVDETWNQGFALAIDHIVPWDATDFPNLFYPAVADSHRCVPENPSFGVLRDHPFDVFEENSQQSTTSAVGIDVFRLLKPCKGRQESC